MSQVKKRLLLEFSKIKLPKLSVEFMQEITTYLSQADVGNRNDRIYPYRILKRQNDKFAGMIKQGRGLGQLDHPQSFQVNLQNVSHMFTDIWWVGKKIFGKFVLLPTPKGQIAKILLNNGAKIGFSSRGAGSLIQGRRGSMDVVDDDYDLVTYDMVSWPSSMNAWVIYQGLNRRIVKQVTQARPQMPLLRQKQNEKYIQQMYKLIKG